MNNVELVYEDDHLAAFHKPSKLLTHRTPQAKGEKESLLNYGQDLMGQKLFTLHRLDKATSGIVLFGKDAITAKSLSQQFAERSIQKTYLALLRGYLKEAGCNERALQEDPTRPFKAACTFYAPIQTIEIAVPVSRYPSSRYTLAVLQPKTGRYHQLRKHMAQLRHYIIGDKKHGDVKHNKGFENIHNIAGLFLHAYALRFTHPMSKESILVQAKPAQHWEAMAKLFDWNLAEILKNCDEAINTSQ